jgi:hypothetical protein
VSGAAPRPPLIAVSEIVRLLTDRIEELAAELIPLGKRHGAEWQDAPASRGGMGDSLSVRLSGPRAGIWSHFASGARGDALDLVTYLKTHGDKAGAIKWAKHWLGIGDGEGWKPDAQAEARARKAREAKAREAEKDSDWRSRKAQRLWLSAPKLEPGDVVDRYLTSRGIGLSQLGRRPGCLHAGQSIVHRDGAHWPAMLAAVVAPDGRHVATHRTYLQVVEPRIPGAAGEVRKAPVDPVKMVLGDFRGACIPVWKGEHKQPLRGLPDGVPVYITEGIEDALSVALLMPEARVVAAISIANMAAIWLPPQVGEVVLVDQNDPATLPNGLPHPTAQAKLDAIAAHARHGRTVRVAKPPPGIKDFNDWVQLRPPTPINRQTAGQHQPT